MAYISDSQAAKSLASNAKIVAAGLMDPFINYRFRIEIEGIEMMGFSKMSALDNKTEVFSYVEGGVNNHAHKFPEGTTTYENITFEHGLSVDNALYNWREDVIKGKISESMRSGTIKVYNQNYMRSIWHFHGAWPCQLTIAELDGSTQGGAVLIESMVLVIERFERLVVLDAVDMALDAAEMLAKTAGKIGAAAINMLKDDSKEKEKPAAEGPGATQTPADPAAAKEDKKEEADKQKADYDGWLEEKRNAAKKAREERASADQAKKDKLKAEREARKENREKIIAEKQAIRDAKSNATKSVEA